MFCDKYVITDRVLGSDCLGRLFMAIDQGTRTQAACKVIDIRKLKSNNVRSATYSDQLTENTECVLRDEIRFLREWEEDKIQLENKLHWIFKEIEVLSSLEHPNILSLKKVYATDKTLYLFQELLTLGNLSSYLKSKDNKLIEVEAAMIIRQVLLALEYLHGQSIIHQNLKPENIMLTGAGGGVRVVLTGFETAHRMKIPPILSKATDISDNFTLAAVDATTKHCLDGSRSMNHSFAFDMYSVGLLTCLSLTGKVPLQQSNPRTIATNSLEILERFKTFQDLHEQPKHFIRQLLVSNDRQRITASQAARDLWLSNATHKFDFNEAYKLAKQCWRAPKLPITSLIEFAQGRSDQIKILLNSKGDFGVPKKRRARTQNAPIELPYQPFPRNMHEKLLWPKKRKLSDRSRDIIQWNRDWNVSSSESEDASSEDEHGSFLTRGQPRLPLANSMTRRSSNNTNSRPLLLRFCSFKDSKTRS